MQEILESFPMIEKLVWAFILFMVLLISSCICNETASTLESITNMESAQDDKPWLKLFNGILIVGVVVINIVWFIAAVVLVFKGLFALMFL